MTKALRQQRPRHVPVSTGKLITPRPRDLLWFEMLHRHGALPFSYLHAFSQQLRPFHYGRGQNRATVLFHEAETAHGGSYLDRPHQQFETLDARYQEAVYYLRPPAIAALHDEGRWHPRAPQPSPNHWRHDFMLSCITASIHLATIGTEYRYIFQDEILDRADSSLSFDAPCYLAGKRYDRPLKPDRIFGIQYPDGKARLFLIEADRGTEPLFGDYSRKTFERSVLQYREFVGKGRYKEALKVESGILVMHVTTSEARLRGMMAAVEKLSDGRGNPYFLFRSLPQFGRFFKPPKPLPHLFTDPWERVGIEAFVLNRKE